MLVDSRLHLIFGSRFGNIDLPARSPPLNNNQWHSAAIVKAGSRQVTYNFMSRHPLCIALNYQYCGVFCLHCIVPLHFKRKFVFTLQYFHTRACVNGIACMCLLTVLSCMCLLTVNKLYCHACEAWYMSQTP